MIDEQAGEQAAAGRADALQRGNRALRGVETAGAAHEIGDDEGREGAEDARTHAVEQLDRDQPPALIGNRVERRAQRQHGIADQQDRLAPDTIGVAADEERDRQHDELRGDDAGRHHRRCRGGMRGGELLAHERQQRRVGEVKKQSTAAEDQQWPALQQRAPCGCARGRVRAAIEAVRAARPRVVDGRAGDGERRDRRQRGEGGHQEEHRALGECPADAAGEDCDRDVAGVVERRVPSEPMRQHGARVEPERERRDGGTEHVAGERDQRIRGEHGPECRKSIDEDGTGAEHRERGDEQRTLGAGRVDRRADRRLSREAEQAADGRDQPDARLRPMLLRDEKDIQIRAERAPDIGEQDIERVERGRMEAGGASIRSAGNLRAHGGLRQIRGAPVTR